MGNRRKERSHLDGERSRTCQHLSSFNCENQKGLEVCYCLWGCHPDPRLGPILGPSRSHPECEGVPSRFAMCFVLQYFGPIQVPRWGHPGPSWSHPAPERSFQGRAWTGRNRLLGHFREKPPVKKPPVRHSPSESLSPLILEFGRTQGDSGKNQGGSVEISGVLYGASYEFSRNSWGFRCSAGLSTKNLGLGRFGAIWGFERRLRKQTSQPL